MRFPAVQNLNLKVNLEVSNLSLFYLLYFTSDDKKDFKKKNKYFKNALNLFKLQQSNCYDFDSVNTFISHLLQKYI